MSRICILATLLVSTAFAQAPVAVEPAKVPVPEFAQMKSVPHGEVRIVWYDSKTYGVQRRMHVYTPPGYERSGVKYPVLYLINGGRHDDTEWSAELYAGFILDNLLAAYKIKPMIVVMPNGDSVPPNPNRGGVDVDSSEGRAKRTMNATKTRDGFVSDLFTAVIPYVDSTYRVQGSRESRAIAGASLGGSEALWAGTPNVDKFAWIGIFGMGLQVGSNAEPGPVSGAASASPADFVKMHATFFADSKRTNKLVRLFWIGVGKDDRTVVDGPKRLADTLTAHDIHNEYREFEGGHGGATWQLCLQDFAPLLFR
jgi:enterochelin esterase family protein